MQLGGASLAARKNGAGGHTPLAIAVDKGHLALAKALMDWGAPADAAANVSRPPPPARRARARAGPPSGP